MNSQFICVTLAIGVLTGACTVSTTGRTQLNYLSSEKEQKLGTKAFKRYAKKRPIAQDPKYNKALQPVVLRMLQAINAPGARWEFVVLEDAKPNAVVLPSGKMGINTGLFHLAETEGCLAAAIGHEMAHVKERHVGEMLSNKKAGSTTAFAAGVILQQTTGVPSSFVYAGIYLANSGRMIKLTKRQELEADQMGILIMAEAGYDPREALTFWCKMKEFEVMNPGAFKHGLFDSHPSIEKRIEAVREIMPKAIVLYHEVQNQR